MKYCIDGYCNFEVIKKYEKLDNKLVVTYLDGSSFEFDLKYEDKILLLMEKQGLNYAKEFNNMNNKCVNLVSGASSLVILFIGTLGWLNSKCSLSNVNDLELFLVSSFGVGIEVILLRKVFFKLAYLMEILEDKEKYKYYFNNKELLGDYIGINELDNYSLSYIKEMLKSDEEKYVSKKVLKRKR